MISTLPYLLLISRCYSIKKQIEVKMKNSMYKLLDSKAGWEMTLLRIVVGVVFMMHGSQKLFGLFGGGGLEGTAAFMSSLGLEPAYVMATLAGLGEFFGGLFILVGFITRLGAISTSIVALVAIFTVHINNGFFMSANGFEYALVLLVASISIFIGGAGKYGLDNEIKKNMIN